MMLCDFMLLAPAQQADLTRKYGAFIAVNDLGPIKVLLYELNGFYVEMYYHCDKAEVEQVRSFYSTDLLEPYLAAIDLSDLFPTEKPAEAEPVPHSSFRKLVWMTLHKLFIM